MRATFLDSLKAIIPTAAVPAAPIPVHTAYALPIGITLTAILIRKILAPIVTTNPAIHFALRNLSLNFTHVVAKISQHPAANNASHTPVTINHPPFRASLACVAS